MLGIPYEGRMPRMDEPWQPAAPPAPEVVAQRMLREEQDAAYQASLMVKALLMAAVLMLACAWRQMLLLAHVWIWIELH